jgi:DNA repair protein RadC
MQRIPAEIGEEIPSSTRDLVLAPLEEEQPRARLLHCGAQVLSDAELLSVLFGLDPSDSAVLDLARALLRERGGLTALVGASPSELRHQGLNEVQIGTLLANLELACRLVRGEFPKRAPVTGAPQVARYVWLRYGGRHQSVVGALWVDARRRLIAERDIYRGTFTRTTVEPREILKEALLMGAAGVIVFQTRPSGDPTPSTEDRAFLRRMTSAGDVLGVEVIDLLIVGGTQEWASLRKRRWGSPKRLLA